MSHKCVGEYVSVPVCVCVAKRSVPCPARACVCVCVYVILSTWPRRLLLFALRRLAVLIAADTCHAPLCRTSNAHPLPPPSPLLPCFCLQQRLLALATSAVLARLRHSRSRPAVCLTIEMSCNKSTSHTHTYRGCLCVCVCVRFSTTFRISTFLHELFDDVR